MNGFVAWLVGGWGFVCLSTAAASLIVVSELVSGGSAGRRVWWLSLLCIGMLLLTAPVAPPALIVAGGFGVLAKRVCGGWLRSAWQRWCVAGAALGCLLAGLGIEAVGWRPLPEDRVARRVVVLGDSLSAGMLAREVTWPEILAERLGVEVLNRARAGARIAQGLTQLDGVSVEGRLVIVFLGGNDMLNEEPSTPYVVSLDRLVAEIRARGGEPVLIQFPGMPGRGDYPRAVRAVAAKHGCRYVHRRVIAGVLAQPGATLDGLHFSAAGHRAFAEALVPWLVEQSR